MEDNTQLLYKTLTDKGLYTKTYDEFTSKYSNPESRRLMFDVVSKEGLYTKTYEEFTGKYFPEPIKKKVSTESPLESATKGETVLQGLGQPSKESITPKLPFQEPKKEKVKQEETFASEPTVTSVLKSRQKLPEYLQGEQERVVEESTQAIKDELTKLRDNYQKKIEANPEKQKELNKQFEEEQTKVIELRSANIPMAIESLYKKGKDYKWLDPTDVKGLSEMAKDIVSKPIDYIQKKDALEGLKKDFMSKVGTLSPEEQSSIEKELNDVIAQSSVISDKGVPSVFGWKNEVANKNAKVNQRIEELSKLPQTEETKAEYNLLYRAGKYYERIMKLPDDEGSFYEGFKSEGRNMLTAGMAELFDAANIRKISKKQADGEPLDKGEQTLYDAYGIFQTAQNADQFGKAYERGKGVAGSVAFMESFALTGGLAGIGEKTALKMLGNQVKSKVVQNIAKGVGSAVVRTPLLTGGMTETAKRMAGSPKLTETGEFKVDPSTIEPTIQAIGKGLYSNFANALGETAGGWLAGTKVNKFVGSALGLNKIPKSVAKVFNTIGMQPLGELPEEYLTTLMETPVMGDQTLKEAFSPEAVWETAVQVGLMSGFFSGIALPSVINENVQRKQNSEMIRMFGKDKVAGLRDAIEKEDFETIYNILNGLEDPTKDQLKQIVRYATSLAQQKGARVAQEAAKIASEEEVDGVNDGVSEGVKPQFKIGDQSFTTKEELNTWLDENYTPQSLSRVDDANTEQAIDEWEKVNKDVVMQKGLEAETKLAEENQRKRVEGLENAEYKGIVDYGEGARDSYDVTTPSGVVTNMLLPHGEKIEKVQQAVNDKRDSFKPKTEESSLLQETKPTTESTESIPLESEKDNISTGDTVTKITDSVTKTVTKSEPITAYHRTDADFTEFDDSKMQKNDAGYAGKGFYFSTTPLSESAGKNLMKVSINLKNPYVRTKENWKNDPLNPYLWIPKAIEGGMTNKEASAAWTKMMQEKGYDGFIDEAIDNGEIVAFSAKQIKVEKDTKTEANPQGDTNVPQEGDNVSTGDVVLSTQERFAKEKELAVLTDKMKAFNKKYGSSLSTDAQIKEFNNLSSQIMSIKHDLRKPINIDKIPDPQDRKSTVPSDIVVTAWNDLVGNKDIFNAIRESAVGVAYNKNTAIDDIIEGKNKNISETDLYNAFNNTRDNLRAKFGNTITLYRAEGKQKAKATKNWISTEEGARQYGDNIIKEEIPIENIIALNVGLTGKYEEFIVGKPPKDQSTITDKPLVTDKKVEEVQGIDRAREIEKIAKDEGYELEIEADNDSDMSSINAYDSGKNRIPYDELPLGIKELVDEFTQLIHDNDISNLGEESTVESSLTEEIPITDTNLPQEGDNASTDSKQGENEGLNEGTSEGINNEPPKATEGKETDEEGGGKKRRERGYFKQLNESSNPSDDLKADIKEAGLTYDVLSNKETAENIDFVLSELGFEKAWEQVKDLNSTISWATRRGLSLRMTFHYDMLSQNAKEAGDVEQADYYRKKAFEVADFADQLGTETGQYNQYAGSAEAVTMLSPSSNVARDNKKIRKQRDKKLADNKEDVKEKKDELRKANKEAIDEVIASKEFEALKKKIADLEAKLAEKAEPKPSKVVPADKVKKEKAFRDQKWDELADLVKKRKQFNKSGSMGLTADPYMEQIVRVAGEIFRSYIKDGAYRTEELLSRFKKEWFKKTGDLITDKEALEYMPKDIDGKPIDDVLAENESKDLAERLTERVKKLLEDPKVKKDDPIKQLLDTLYAKIEEKDTKEKPEKVKKTNVDKIREAILNQEQYADVWAEAKEKVDLMIEMNEDLSEDQKSDQKKRLASFFEEVIGKPYAEKQVEGAVKEKIKEKNIDLNKIVRQHYTVQDATGRSLAEKLVDELGLSGEQATLLAKAVQDQFNKVATEKKRRILLQGIKNKARALDNPKQVKLEWEKFIELTNMGAFTNAEFAEAYADIYGFPKLTDQNKADLLALAEKVQKTDGFKKDQAVQDYLNYIAKLPGIDYGEVAMAIWYSFVLSGARTQFKNFFGNFTNTVAEFGVAMAYNFNKNNFESIPFMINAMWNAGGIAKAELSHTLKTGYAPIKHNKIEAGNYMERWRFRGKANPLNAPKYVARLMMGVDTFFYTGLKEMRAAELAMREARKENLENSTPSKTNWALATEKLYGTKQRRIEAEMTATNEGLKGNEKKKRVWELMEKSRGTDIITESNTFASRGTYNYKPEGAIGSATDAIGHWFGNRTFTMNNRLTGNKPLNIHYGKFFVPFTRIIANVANTALDYFPPTGYMRSYSGTIGNEKDASHYRKYTEEERKKIAIKATMGTMAMIALYGLSEPPEDEDKEPMVSITSNGYGDYQRNYELKATGWQPYSIKVGGKWYSYQYTPLFVALAPIGFLRDIQKYKKDKWADQTAMENAMSVLLSPAQTISDMTVLTSLAGLLGAVTGEGFTTIDAFFKKFATGTLKGFVYPKAIEQTMQMYDDMLDNPQKYSSSFLGKVIKDTPVLKNYFPIQYNSFGEPISYDAIQMINKETNDPYANFLADKGLNIGTVAQKGEFAIIYDTEAKIERGMDDREYMEFTKLSGQEIKRRIMEEVMPYKMTDSDIKKEVTNIKSEVRNQVKTEMFGWSDFRMSNPEDWKVLRDNHVIQVPQSKVENVRIDEKEVITFSEEEVKTINDNAMAYYSEWVIKYLNTPKSKEDKSTPVLLADGGQTTVFEKQIGEMWAGAKRRAKGELIDKKTKGK